MQPFQDLKAQFEAHRDEVLAAVQRVLESGRYVLSGEVVSFETEFGAYLGGAHVVGVSSGMAALELALRAMDIGAGDEVIVPALTAAPTALAVCAVGAVPRIADVDPDTFTLDPGSVAAELTQKTRAIVPVHLYGQCAAMEPLRTIAAERGLAVIEDAAQAHGASQGGHKAGTLGDVACFSFYPTKNLGSYGDAGAVVTRDEGLAARVRALRNYGNRGDYRFDEAGLNERLDELHAAILRAKLPHLDAWNERRRENAAFYLERLAEALVRLPVERAGDRHVYHQFVVRTERRDALREHLARCGVETGIHYPAAVHQLKALRERATFAQRPKHAEALVGELLSLPIYPELPRDQRARAADAVLAFA